jgi:hypothetical protein
MRATLSFKLPEEGVEHYYALNGADMAFAIQEFQNWLRALDRYEGKSEVKIDEVRDKLSEILRERDLDPWRG